MGATIRQFLIFLCIVLFFNKLIAQTPQAAIENISYTRQQICLNGLWKFLPAVGDAEAMPTNDWGTIWVPGAWSKNAWWTSTPVVEKFGTSNIWNDQLSSLVKAWYEKSIFIPANWKNKAILLEIGRISTDCIVYIDDQKIGTLHWPGGTLEITPFVKTGESHVLRLLVIAASSQNQVFEFMGTANAQATLKPAELSSRGITGEVFLKCQPLNTYISDVFVQTSVKQKELRLDIEFSGIEKSDTLEITACLLNEQGVVEQKFTGLIQTEAVRTQIKSISWKWYNPRLWDIDVPNLYTLKLLVKSNFFVDEYSQEFGFREFYAEGRNFYLNNKKINLRPTSNTPGNGNYALTDSAIYGLRKAGYNFFEIWPQNIIERGMLQYNEVFMDRADRSGVLISAPLPASTSYIMDSQWQFKWNIPGMKAEWEKQMFSELRKYRNHPSVVMWGLNPNFFGHSDDQNPIVIGQRGWIKEDIGWQTNAQAGVETVEMIKKYDPTRLVFNHHGAYTGDIHTLNFYLCLTPLQERIEWLSHYSQFGNMPFMAIELGTPLENTMLRGRASFGESIVTEPLFTEYAAIYQGKKAYETENASYRQEIKNRFLGNQLYKNWQNNKATNFLPSFQELQHLFSTQTWRAWRTFGISGGMVPWNDGHGWIRQPTSAEKVSMPPFVSGQRGTYFNTVLQGDLNYFDSKYWDILPSAKALIDNNSETLSWIAGSPDKFTEKSHNFSCGEKIVKQIVLINDSRIELPFSYSCKVLLGHKVIHQETSEGIIYPSDVAKKKLDFVLPAKLKGLKTTGEIRLEARIGNCIHHDTLAFEIFNQEKFQKMKVVCFDPLGKTSAMLQKLGYITEAWTGNMDTPVLVIGREALSGKNQTPADLQNYVEQGGKLVVMSQTPDWYENIGFRVAKHLPRRVFKVNNNHPLLKGLADNDLSDWNGKSTIVEDYPDYLNRQVKKGMYGVPYYGWHWGNQGALSGGAIEKPHNSAWKPILECEFDLAYTTLMELSLKRGHVILCSLDLEDYYQSEPVAEILSQRLISYAYTLPVEKAKTKVCYLGNEQGENLLKQSHILFEKIQKVSQSDGLLVMGIDASASDSELHAYLEKGGKAVVLNACGKSFLGVDYIKKQVAGALNIPDWAETDGISVSDMRWRTDASTWLINSGCEIGADGFLGRKAIGKGLLYLCQINPDVLRADSLTYFRFTRWRQTRGLNQFLSNLGVSYEADLQLFGKISTSDYIDLQGEWKARLIKKLPVTLSVVGGNEDTGISENAKVLLDFNADEKEMEIVRVPMAMERYGKEWTDANGEIVFRKTIDIPESMIGKDIELELGVIDDFDETFFNGQKVGSTDVSNAEYWGFERKYKVPAGLVKPGKNVIAIRVFDRFGSGGLLGSEKPMRISVAKQDGVPDFYHSDYLKGFVLGDDPYRYFRW